MTVFMPDTLLYEIGVMLNRALRMAEEPAADMVTSDSCRDAMGGYDLCGNVEAMLDSFELNKEDWNGILAGVMCEEDNVAQQAGRKPILDLFKEFMESYQAKYAASQKPADNSPPTVAGASDALTREDRLTLAKELIEKQYKDYYFAMDRKPSSYVRQCAAFITSVTDAEGILYGFLSDDNEDVEVKDRLVDDILSGKKNLYAAAYAVFNRAIEEGVTPTEVVRDYIEVQGGDVPPAKTMGELM